MKLLSFLLFIVTAAIAKAQGPLHFITLQEAEDHIVFSLPHHLTNSFSNKVIDVEDGIFGGAARGNKLQLYDRHGPVFGGSDGNNQLWYIIPSGVVDGKQTFRFLNAGYMNFMTAGGSDGFSSAATGAESNEQRWFLAQDNHNANSNGFYILSAGLLLGSPLANYHSSKDNNSRLGLRSFSSGSTPDALSKRNYNFFITDFEVDHLLNFNGGVCQLQPKNATSKSLDLQAGNVAENTPIQIWGTDNNNANEQWTLSRKTIVGFNTGFSIAAVSSTVHTKRLVVIQNGATANGTAAVLNNVSTPQVASKHLWLFLPVLREQGTFVLIAYNNSGKCLDVRGVGTSDGTPTQLWTFQNNSNQKWNVKKLR